MGPGPGPMGPMGPGPDPKGSWNDQNDKKSLIVGRVSRQIRGHRGPGPLPADAKQKVSMTRLIFSRFYGTENQIFEKNDFDPVKL